MDVIAAVPGMISLIIWIALGSFIFRKQDQLAHFSTELPEKSGWLLFGVNGMLLLSAVLGSMSSILLGKYMIVLPILIWAAVSLFVWRAVGSAWRGSQQGRWKMGSMGSAVYAFTAIFCFYAAGKSSWFPYTGTAIGIGILAAANCAGCLLLTAVLPHLAAQKHEGS